VAEVCRQRIPLVATFSMNIKQERRDGMLEVKEARLRNSLADRRSEATSDAQPKASTSASWYRGRSSCDISSETMTPSTDAQSGALSKYEAARCRPQRVPDRQTRERTIRLRKVACELNGVVLLHARAWVGRPNPAHQLTHRPGRQRVHARTSKGNEHHTEKHRYGCWNSRALGLRHEHYTRV
jgi:hypothetical protein